MQAAWCSWLHVPPSRVTTSDSTSYQTGSESISSPSMSNKTAAAVTGAEKSSGVEVLGFRVVHDDRVCRLLRYQLERLRQSHADPLRVPQLDNLGAVLEVRTGGITEGVARPAVTLMCEQVGELRRVLGREAELFTDALVPVLRERFGELHGQAVQLQVVTVGVASEQFCSDLRHLGADRHQLERDDVYLAGLFGPEEVGQAQETVASLPREGEAHPLRPVVVQHDQVVALGHAGEVAVDDTRIKHVLALHPLEPHPQAGTPLSLDQLVVGRTVAAGRTQTPLAEERRPLVEHRCVVGELHAL